MYDAIVVGARCAGAPTAMLLAGKGHRVLLVDRAAFPSDTLSTHFVRHQGLAALRRWGLLERVLASNSPALRRWSMSLGDRPLVGNLPDVDGVPAGCAPRRRVLDAILVEAATAAGAELRTRFAVEELIWEDGRVAGLRGRTARGATVEERGRIVIGADGRNSFVARAVGAPVHNLVPARTCAYYGYWDGVDLDGFEVHILAQHRRYLLAFGTNDARVLVLVGWPREEFAAVRADPDAAVRDALGLVPELGDRVRAGRLTERLRGTADLDNFFRQAHGPGWALVGDAGHHKDPYPAWGIMDAFRDAEALVEAVDAGLTGRRPLEEALAEYEARRNDAALPRYDRLCHALTFPPPSPALLELRAALREDPDLASGYLGVWAGTIRQDDFVAGAPEPIRRLLRAAAAG
jgi:2-polyprenyl-6-methoxyphenol hydroxylase-like FAD-dependent oxidoreductase